MADNRDKIIAIFIEESTEIIEQLESEIMLLDGSPWDKSIINEIFRGVHTLKGNANSFGFNNLGGFVHYFEDLLDFYRDPEHQPDKEMIDLFFDAFDIIKNVFALEKEGSKAFPEDYDTVLAHIKEVLDVGSGTSEDQERVDSVVEKHHYHHEKFDSHEITTFPDTLLETMRQACAEDGTQLYNITMEFDSDLYTRGYNHLLFFRLFKEIGTIIRSIWYMQDVPTIESFDTQESYIRRISLYLLSDSPLEEVEDVFEFIAEDEEVGISIVDLSLLDGQEREQTPHKSDETLPAVSNEMTDVDVTKKRDTAETTPKPKSADATAPRSIRVESSKLDELFDSIGELVIAQSFLDQNQNIRSLNDHNINQSLNMLNKITRSIQNQVMNLRMIPIRDSFLKMKRVVRDLSRKTGKEVRLELNGEETEIDKTMIDSLSEPLIHLIRNAIDHGLEQDSQERLDNGKPAAGRVDLSAMHKGSSFVIEIKDDGKGIDTDKIRQRAIEKGLADEHTEYTRDQILHFLLLPGFSTAETITDISGRGVGLDAVKKSIDALKGKIQIESRLGMGSTFTITLPLTLAIIDGMSVSVDGKVFIIPTLSVVESFRADLGAIKSVSGKGEFIDFRDEILPIIKLDRLLELDEDGMREDESTLICIEHERGRFMLQVQEIIGRQQVVIKPLNRKLLHVKEISGSAILGNGSIALILNIEAIREWLDEEA